MIYYNNQPTNPTLFNGISNIVGYLMPNPSCVTSPCAVMAKVQDCDYEVREFKIQSPYYVYLGKA